MAKREQKLTDDELKWYATTYIKNRFNGSKTYQEFSEKFRNGCSVKSANVSATNIMKKYRNEIYGYVEAFMKEEQKKSIASAEEVMEFYTDVMRGDLKRTRRVVCRDQIEEIDEMPTVSESLKGADGLARAYGMSKEKKEVDYGSQTLKAISDLSLNEKTRMVQDLLKEIGE